MRLYQKLIRPMRCYPGQYYEPKTEPIEKEEKWYPEEEREYLENKYGYLNKGSFSDLVFEEKYEPCDDLALLKEQEPIPVKDVQWHEVTRKRMINGICPTCNSIITHFNGSRFCDKCGQAVKWE